MTRRSFTLVELLVVIGILAVLSALILGVTSRTRSKGQQTACLSQVHQLGLAIHLYADDHDDRLPRAARLGPDPIYQLPSLRQTLAPYVEEAALFHCPADRGSPTLFADVGTSYEWNTLLSGRMLNRTTLTIVGLELRTPMLGDAEAFHPDETRNVVWPDGHVTTSAEGLIE